MDMRTAVITLVFFLAGAVSALADSSITPPTGKTPACRPHNKQSQEFIKMRRQVQMMLCFHVETDGSVKDPTVVQSSGDEVVDRDAASCASHWHFTPAMKDGTPVRYVMTQPFSWCATQNTLHRRPCPPLANSDEVRAKCEQLLSAGGQSPAPQ